MRYLQNLFEAANLNEILEAANLNKIIVLDEM